MNQNPKQVGTSLEDCRVQVGPCPLNCPECFYNRETAFYESIYDQHIPKPEDVKDKIVRVNCGHDSNVDRQRVIDQAVKYKQYFFNTSLPNLNFPGPVVLTLNGRDELDILTPGKVHGHLTNLMFVRLRISTQNFEYVRLANDDSIFQWVDLGIPVILTFTSFYTRTPPFCTVNKEKTTAWRKGKALYEWKVRTLNEYWCPTSEFMLDVWSSLTAVYGCLINMCGTPQSGKCVDCKNCETYYWQTKKRLEFLGDEK